MLEIAITQFLENVSQFNLFSHKKEEPNRVENRP